MGILRRSCPHVLCPKAWQRIEDIFWRRSMLYQKSTVSLHFTATHRSQAGFTFRDLRKTIENMAFRTPSLICFLREQFQTTTSKFGEWPGLREFPLPLRFLIGTVHGRSCDRALICATISELIFHHVERLTWRQIFGHFSIRSTRTRSRGLFTEKRLRRRIEGPNTTVT